MKPRAAIPGGVLLVANNFPPVRGGSASVYDSLARFARGRVTVLAPRISYTDGLPMPGWREHDRGAPYPVVRVPLLRTVIPALPPRGMARLGFLVSDALLRACVATWVAWLILRLRARAVCVGELLASAWLLRLLRFVPGVRSLVYVHGEELTTADHYDPERRVAHSALQAADAIIVVSRFTRAVVADMLGPSAEAKIHLIENGVDTGRFSPKPKSEALLRFYDLAGRFVFIAVCRLVEKKGIDNAIRAFARIAARHPDTSFLVVGTGSYEPALRALVEAEGLVGRVRFTGQVAEDELTEHYQLGDVFLMPNRAMPDGDTEGFGLVFLEANACGIPAIAGRDGGSTDAVRDGVNGLVVNGHDIDAIAAAMLAMREQQDLYERLRQGALSVAAAAQWQNKSEAFLKLCLEDQPAPRAGAATP
jgi:phosphatidylinositol alpha-1,6-mannosyltransferase